MTSDQIAYALSQNDYDVDTWTNLSGVSMLTLTASNIIYTSNNQYMFYFDTTTELVKIAVGRLNSMGIFVSINGEEFDSEDADNISLFTPDSFVSFEHISGVVSSTYMGPQGTYYTKPFIGKTQL
jgi:hypothetical protein